MTENSSLIQNYIKSASVSAASDTLQAGLHWLDTGDVKANVYKETDLYKCSAHRDEISSEENCSDYKPTLKSETLKDQSRRILDTTPHNILPNETTKNLRTLKSNICQLLDTARKHDQEKNTSRFDYNSSTKSFGEAKPIVKQRTSEIHAFDSGGRLQFFKDGKFILELARVQGDKPGWVSVPKKALLPPQTSFCHIKTPMTYESLATKKLYGRNSDHFSHRSKDQSWKNGSPQRNASKNLVMYYVRTRHHTLSREGCKVAYGKRRRPFDKTICKKPFNPVENFFLSADQPSRSKMVDVENKNRRKHKKCRPKLNAVLQSIIDKLPITLFFLSKTSTSSNVISHLTTAPRFFNSQSSQQHVSPRKRILRELEKVSLEDGNTKRSRPKNNIDLPTSSIPAKQNVQCVSNSSNSSASNSNLNSNSISLVSSSSSLRNSSYSIHSLLGNTVHKRRFANDRCGADSWSETNADSLKTIITLSKINENDAPKIFGSMETPRNRLLHSPLSKSSQNETEVADVDATLKCSTLRLYPRYSTDKIRHTTGCQLNDTIFSDVSCMTDSPPHEISGSRSGSISPLKCSSASSNVYQQEKELFPSSTVTKDFISSPFTQKESSPTKDKQSTPPDGSDETVKVFSKGSPLNRHQLSLHSYSSKNESVKLYLPPLEQTDKYENDRLNLSDDAGYFSNVDSSTFRSCSTIPSSSLYNLHSMCKPAFSRSPSPTYTPPIAYLYAPYSTAVTALRNPMWMRYTTTLLPPPETSFHTSHISLPRNVGGANPESRISLVEHGAHLRGGLWKQKDQQIDTAFPGMKQEPNSDTPLNLSKH